MDSLELGKKLVELLGSHRRPNGSGSMFPILTDFVSVYVDEHEIEISSYNEYQSFLLNDCAGAFDFVQKHWSAFEAKWRRDCNGMLKLFAHLKCLCKIPLDYKIREIDHQPSMYVTYGGSDINLWFVSYGSDGFIRIKDRSISRPALVEEYFSGHSEVYAEDHVFLAVEQTNRRNSPFWIEHHSLARILTQATDWQLLNVTHHVKCDVPGVEDNPAFIEQYVKPLESKTQRVLMISTTKESA